jgi:hypothetical protein
VESQKDRIDALIVRAALGESLADATVKEILRHVASAGFDTAINARAVDLAGIVWQGRRLTGATRVSSAEQHYLKHVLRDQEWPPGTDVAAYLASLRDVILAHESSVFTSRYRGEWQLGVVGESESIRGLGGGPIVLVEYRTGLGRWVTGHQLLLGVSGLESPSRTDIRWLRRTAEFSS